MSDEMIYHPISRMVSGSPLALWFPAGTTVFPARARDDLDPYSPPLEYTDGRISWSGYPTREARDAAREQQEEQEREERQLAALRREEDLQRRAREWAAAIWAHRSHHAVVRTGGPYAFQGPVAAAGHENPAAHGCVRWEDSCDCGAIRSRLVNQMHEEIGPWGSPGVEVLVAALQARAR